MRYVRITGYTLAFVIGGFFMTALNASTLKAPTYLSADVELQNYRTVSWGPKEIRSYLHRYARLYPQDKLRELSTTIYRLCRRYDLEPGLILSVLRVESAFQIRAISPKGALGLMQLMPDTADWLAERLGVDLEDEDAVFKPEVNLRLGIYYLSYLRKLYNGDMRKALVAYNRGPANVEVEFGQGGQLILGYYHKVRRNLARLTFSAI